MKRLSSLGLLALLLSLAAPSQALFGDEEARKAIVDLRDQVAQLQKEHSARIDELSQRLDRIDNLVQAIQRGQLESGGQFDGLHQELAKLRGLIEQLTNDVATLQKRNHDLYSDLDARIKRLEPTSVTVEGKSVQVDRDEQAAYESAMALFKANDFRTAVGGLSGFLARYPQSAYAAAAQFWLGTSYYAIKDYRSAIAAQQALIDRFPDSPRAPDALLNIAASQIELNDKKSARATLSKIVQDFPDSDAAKLAKERLASLGTK
ncbi:MAG TPA: tol-pal system protein YbgF [Burkholderiaceae bacterium]|nr:tol-pal system protein YbgF [Burkholderiaceae bacterium]